MTSIFTPQAQVRKAEQGLGCGWEDSKTMATLMVIDQGLYAPNWVSSLCVKDYYESHFTAKQTGAEGYVAFG